MFAVSLSSLPPEPAARVFAEGTRAANKLLIVDVRRPSAPVHLVALAVVLPFTRLAPLAHDGFVTSLVRIARRRCVRSPIMPTRRLPSSSAPDGLSRWGWLPVAPSELANRRRESLRHRDNGR